MVIRHADDGRVPIDSFTDDGLDALEDAFDAMGLDHQLHRDVPRGYREALDDLLGWGFLRMEDGTIRITDEGLRQVESVTGSMEGPDVSVLAASVRLLSQHGGTVSRRGAGAPPPGSDAMPRPVPSRGPTCRSEGRPAGYAGKAPFEPYPRLTPVYRGVVNRIIDMDRTLGSYTLSSKDYLDAVVDACSSDIHRSTGSEGNPLTRDEVGTIVRSFIVEGDIDVPDGPVREIVNHLHLLFSDSKPVPWTHDRVKSLHGALIGGTGRPGPVGEYRRGDVPVTGDDGPELPGSCPFESIDSGMESLLSWLPGSPLDPVCTAAVFLHRFECIRPFVDGNGMTGRALMRMFLRESGLRNCGLCRFESHLLRDPDLYRRLSAHADSTGDHGPFVQYFSEVLLDAYVEADRVFSERDRMRHSDGIGRSLVLLARTGDGFSIRRASECIPSVHENTLRSRLNVLIGQGIVRMEGRGRSTVYRFDDPLRGVRTRVNGPGPGRP